MSFSDSSLGITLTNHSSKASNMLDTSNLVSFMFLSPSLVSTTEIQPKALSYISICISRRSTRSNYILDSPILSNLILCLVAWSLIQGACNSRLCQCDIVSHPTKHLRAGPSQKIKKTLNTCGRGPPGIYIYTCELASCACRLVIFYF